MCIRDSLAAGLDAELMAELREVESSSDSEPTTKSAWLSVCLLYTSDAADERSSVDLGGRRIIKKKQHHKKYVWASFTAINNYMRVYQQARKL